jgi:hypothetical protein
MDACYATARRIFRMLGEEASAFDSFSKHQKQEMFRIQVMPPRVHAMPGHRVPKPYIRYVQEELIAYMKNVYCDKEAGVTWMDMATIGEMLEMIFGVDAFVNKLPEKQREVVERLNKAIKERSLFLEAQETIVSHIKTSLIMLSQPNFRIYGQGKYEYVQAAHKISLQPVMYITAHDCRPLRFKYRNKERTAFRVAIGQCMETPYIGGVIAMSSIFPNIKNDRPLNIYIQSHAIHRIKERIDTFIPGMRNQFFVLSLMIDQRVVNAPNGTKLIPCLIPSEREKRTIGYFVFTIDGDNLLVLTFLPLLSYNVPEGRVLYERLRLSADDLIYLGMDKLSFFYNVDIEQIPQLKKVLFDELHLNYIRKIYNSYRTRKDPYDEKKTLFVKNFFQKLEEQPADRAEVFNDLEELDL